MIRRAISPESHADAQNLRISLLVGRNFALTRRRYRPRTVIKTLRFTSLTRVAPRVPPLTPTLTIANAGEFILLTCFINRSTTDSYSIVFFKRFLRVTFCIRDITGNVRIQVWPIRYCQST